MTGLFKRARYIAVHHYACNGHVLNGHVQARQLLPVYRRQPFTALHICIAKTQTCVCTPGRYLAYLGIFYTYQYIDQNYFLVSNHHTFNIIFTFCASNRIISLLPSSTESFNLVVLGHSIHDKTWEHLGSFICNT